MIQAVLRPAIVAVWHRRPCGAGWLPPIAVTLLACTACSHPQAARPLMSDVSCVRSVEAAGGSFSQAAGHCQKNPFNTSFPTMLDLSGAPDLQKQAFDDGYYNRDLPASSAAEAARLQTLQARLADAMAVRRKSQGKTVKQLSGTECMTTLLAVPHEAFVLGPSWDGGGQSPANPYLTPQENDCVARQRETASASGAVATAPPAATEAQKVEQTPLPAPFVKSAPLVKESANAAHKSKAAHSAGVPAVEMYKTLIL
jgi:hypothetical protein